MNDCIIDGDRETGSYESHISSSTCSQVIRFLFFVVYFVLSSPFGQLLISLSILPESKMPMRDSHLYSHLSSVERILRESNICRLKIGMITQSPIKQANAYFKRQLRLNMTKMYLKELLNYFTEPEISHNLSSHLQEAFCVS